MFQLYISGLGQIYHEYMTIHDDVELKINRGLSVLESEMRMSLGEHIMSDMYSAWGEPKAYDRTYAMLSNDAIESKSGNLKLEFYYEPHWDAPSTGNYGVAEKSGNELIEVIQTNSGWTYKPNEDTNGRKIMPRPFWNNFVRELRDSLIINTLADSLSGYIFIPEGDDVILDGTELLAEA